MMKEFRKISLILILILGFMTHIGNAQELRGILEGFVYDSQTREPLEAVNVILLDTQNGAATDKNGYFKILNINPGEYEVKAQSIGYKSSNQKIEIKATETLKILINLEPTVLEGAEVTIESERIEDIRLEITPPTFKLRPQEVQQMAGAQEDIMRSILSLPGVHSVSDFSNQFIVRGGGPDQNLILLDDVEIFNPYRNSGMASLIDPDMIKDINLYAGGYPAPFGDRLSSVLTIHTRDGSKDKWLAGKLKLNLTNARFLLEGKIPFLNGSWLINKRSTHNQFFSKSFVERRTQNNVAMPDFEDWHGKITLNPNSKHRLQFHGIWSRNNQDFLVKDELGEQDSEREGFDGKDEIKTKVSGVSWSYFPSKNLQLKVHLNLYENTGKSSFAGDFIPANDGSAFSEDGPPPPVFAGGDTTFLFAHDQKFNFRKTSLGSWIVFERSKHVFEAGFGIDYLENSVDSELELSDFGQVVFEALQTAPNFFGALGDSFDQNASYQRSYIYLQDKFKLGPKTIIQPGLRFDYSELNKSRYVSPRLRVTYQLNPITSINAAWGLYRQNPGFEKLLDGGQVFDLLKFEDLAGLLSEKAVHTLLGAQRWLNEKWHITLEAYHKKFNDLIEQSIELVERPVAVYLTGAPGLPDSYIVKQQMLFRKTRRPINDITGNAYGLDFRLEKRIKYPSDNFFGWLSYSYGKSTRKQAIAGMQLTYPYEFDRRHSIDLVLNYKIDSELHKDNKMIIGVTWRYGTGFPYTPALAVEPLVAEIAIDPANPDVTKPTILADPETGAARFVPTFGGPENINSLRYPDYNRLDVRITYLLKLEHSELQFYIDFVNVYNNKNVLFYRSIIKTEVDETLPLALQFLQVRAFEEPVYMYPFVLFVGISLNF